LLVVGVIGFLITAAIMYFSPGQAIERGSRGVFMNLVYLLKLPILTGFGVMAVYAAIELRKTYNQISDPAYYRERRAQNQASRQR